MKTVRSLPFRALSLLILAALLTASTVFAAPAAASVTGRGEKDKKFFENPDGPVKN